MKNKTTNIHVERARHKISQECLAKAVGCTRQSIHAIENGKTVASCKLALKIATYFNTTVENIFT